MRDVRLLGERKWLFFLKGEQDGLRDDKHREFFDGDSTSMVGFTAKLRACLGLDRGAIFDGLLAA
eukprot:1583048-Rhodomonas_salina.3